MKSRITRIVANNLIPISEKHFRTFTKYDVLENSSVVAWKADNPSPQDTFLVDIWSTIEDVLKFKTVFKNMTDENFDEIFEPPYSEDIYLVPISDYTFRRERLIMPFFNNWYEVYIARSAAEVTSAFYYNIFPIKAWIIELCMVAVLPLIFWTMCFLSNKFSLKKRRLGLSDCSLQIISLITNQGTNIKTTTFCVRLLSFTVMLFGFLITVWYSALLIASQAVSIEAPALTSLKDVKRVRSHQICTVRASWSLTNFKSDDDEYLPEWKDLINGPICPDDPDELLSATCYKKIVSLVLFKHFTHENGIRFGTCVVLPFKAKYFNEMALILAGSRFPHTKAIERLINKMRNTGLLQNLWQRTKIYIPPIEAPTNQKPEVTFSHVEGVFIVYGICAFFALLILAIEIIVHNILFHRLGPNCLPYID